MIRDNDISLSHTAKIVQLQRRRMERFVNNNVPGSVQEAEEIKKKLQFQQQLIKNPMVVSEDSSVIDKFLNELAQQLNAAISQTLSVAQWAKNDNDVNNAISKIKDITAQELDKPFSDSKTTLRKSDFDNVLMKIKDIISSPSKASLTTNINELEKIYKSLLELQSQIEWSKYVPKGQNRLWGYNISLDSDLAKRANRILNQAQSLIKIETMSQNIGIVGEQAMAALFALAYSTKEIGVEELTSLLSNVKSGQFSNGDTTVTITGEDKSQHGYYAKQQSKFTKTARQLKKQTSDGSFFGFHATNDKVDIEIEIKDKSMPIRASIKNLSDPSSTTLLSGNIYPILARYQNFMNHYMQLISSSESEGNKVTGNLQRMYQAIKFTTGIHALVGGVLAMKNDAIVQTKTAQYLIVNNNQTGQIDVFSTRDVAKQILENTELIKLLNDNKIDETVQDKMNRIQAKILAYYNKNSDVDNRFSNIKVLLHIDALKRSIKKLT